MSWPFLAVFFSGWLFVDASYRGPRWQRWVFKPVTLLLLLLLAWQAPVLGAAAWLAFRAIFDDATDSTRDQVERIGS